MQKRIELLTTVKNALKRSRVVALLGPRQCGKTTLARQIVPANSLNYFDLENPQHLARLAQPMQALEDLTGVVVIDEVQRRPELFPILRVLADRSPLPARFLVLGSSSPALSQQTSESLAGRIERITMHGFTLAEIGADNLRRHWLRGGFPLSYLAVDDAASTQWRRDFVQTFLERDLPQFGFSIPATTMLRFWTMLAHYHGQIWNTAQVAQSLGVSQQSVRRYLDVLTDLYMARQLPPWHANLKKRQVRTPKIFFLDTGLLHQLLGIRSAADLLTHPKVGASWEGYVIEAVLQTAQPDEAYFWATHQGAEIDLVMIKDGKMFGVECKRVDAPSVTPSMRIALADLGLERIAVVYPGKQRFALAPQIEAVPMLEALQNSQGLFGN